MIDSPIAPIRKEISHMRKTLGAAAIVAAGLLFGLGGSSEPSGKSMLLVYSTDERGELHPCG
jgi:hypothetical protein